LDQKGIPVSGRSDENDDAESTEARQ
jgi:hypothetical protein